MARIDWVVDQRWLRLAEMVIGVDELIPLAAFAGWRGGLRSAAAKRALFVRGGFPRALSVRRAGMEFRRRTHDRL